MCKGPNCYECKHRGEVPGDSHSCCEHPKLKEKYGDFHSQLQLIAVVANGATGVQVNPLGVTGDPHGIKNGWFMWPMNFDPIWLRSCDGFESEKSQDQLDDEETLAVDERRERGE